MKFQPYNFCIFFKCSPERDMVRAQHEEVISQLNQRLADKAGYGCHSSVITELFENFQSLLQECVCNWLGIINSWYFLPGPCFTDDLNQSWYKFTLFQWSILSYSSKIDSNLMKQVPKWLQSILASFYSDINNLFIIYITKNFVHILFIVYFKSHKLIIMQYV